MRACDPPGGKAASGWLGEQFDQAEVQLSRRAQQLITEQLGEDIASVNLVISGQRSVLARTGDEIIDLIRNGQGVLNVLPLAGVKDELDAAIVQFPAEETGVATGAARQIRATGS